MFARSKSFAKRQEYRHLWICGCELSIMGNLKKDNFSLDYYVANLRDDPEK